jgi:hypothetical protein
VNAHGRRRNLRCGYTFGYTTSRPRHLRKHPKESAPYTGADPGVPGHARPEREPGAVDSNNDVSGGLHNVMPAFCRDLTGTSTTSRVNAQWCGPLWRIPETWPEGARQLLSSRWNKAATITSRDGRRCRRSVWLRWRLGRQAMSARSLTCLVSWRPWRGARPGLRRRPQRCGM